MIIIKRARALHARVLAQNCACAYTLKQTTCRTCTAVCEDLAPGKAKSDHVSNRNTLAHVIAFRFPGARSSQTAVYVRAFVANVILVSIIEGLRSKRAIKRYFG